MRTVVITGGSRGIGRGLAKRFLERGQQVVVSGRRPETTQRAVQELGALSDPAQVHGQACEVTDHAQLEQLWQSARERFGKVDIWINNAGISHLGSSLVETEPDELRSVVEVNLLGVLYGSRVALRGMQEQGGGHLYNMEGLGSDGRIVPGRGPYGATKRALRHLTETLVKEVEGSPVKVSALSPGIVVTDFILDNARNQSPESWARARKVMNILADTPETVTPWLADRVLEHDRNGGTIAWLTTPKIAGRFMTAPLRKRDLFGPHGL